MADVLGGKYPGIPEPIAGTRARGWNFYFPIPYAKHCKVTSDEGDFYYHINYRTYPPGTRIVSNSQSELEAATNEAELCADMLQGRRGSPFIGGLGTPPESWQLEESAPLMPGQSHTVWNSPDYGEPWAISVIRMKVETKDRVRALRALQLTIEFDGEETVRCPLGDFFGAGPGVNPYDSLPLSIKDDGELRCYWIMPYRESARITVRNAGDRPVRLLSVVGISPHKWTGRSMYFYVQWKPAFGVPTRPMQDWNYVEIEGQGVFAGAAFSIANPVRNWWGEGDEKIYVDGEEFPSHAKETRRAGREPL